LHFYFIVGLGEGTLWYLQKFLQSIKSYRDLISIGGATYAVVDSITHYALGTFWGKKLIQSLHELWYTLYATHTLDKSILELVNRLSRRRKKCTKTQSDRNVNVLEITIYYNRINLITQLLK
jgi:hypothetical protein